MVSIKNWAVIGLKGCDQKEQWDVLKAKAKKIFAGKFLAGHVLGLSVSLLAFGFLYFLKKKN